MFKDHFIESSVDHVKKFSFDSNYSGLFQADKNPYLIYDEKKSLTFMWKTDCREKSLEPFFQKRLVFGLLLARVEKSLK